MLDMWDDARGWEAAMKLRHERRMQMQESAREGLRATKRRELWQRRADEMRCDDGRVLTEGDLVELIEGMLR